MDKKTLIIWIMFKGQKYTKGIDKRDETIFGRIPIQARRKKQGIFKAYGEIFQPIQSKDRSRVPPCLRLAACLSTFPGVPFRPGDFSISSASSILSPQLRCGQDDRLRIHGNHGLSQHGGRFRHVSGIRFLKMSKTDEIVQREASFFLKIGNNFFFFF